MAVALAIWALGLWWKVFQHNIPKKFSLTINFVIVLSLPRMSASNSLFSTKCSSAVPCSIFVFYWVDLNKKETNSQHKEKIKIILKLRHKKNNSHNITNYCIVKNFKWNKPYFSIKIEIILMYTQNFEPNYSHLHTVSFAVLKLKVPCFVELKVP